MKRGRLFLYLDPGTGSIIIQAIVAAFVAAGAAVKLYWGRLKQFFAKLFNKKD